MDSRLSFSLLMLVISFIPANARSLATLDAFGEFFYVDCLGNFVFKLLHSCHCTLTRDLFWLVCTISRDLCYFSSS